MVYQKMHLVMLVDAWFPRYQGKVGVFGGGQVHVRELKKKLEQNHNCHIEVFYPGHPNILIRAFWSFFVVIKILNYAKAHPVQLIHSHGFNSGIPGKIASLILNVPVIHTVHGSALLDQNQKTPKAWLEKIILTQIKYDAQITVANKFLDYPNVNQNRYIIPNGVNLAEFNAVKVNKHPKPSLIWVGRNDKVKGLDVLKKAILKVRKTIPRVKSNLVTGGKLHGKALIKAYKRAHVFVLSSYAEGQPITLLEAWAAKLPVVVTSVGDNPKMVQDGVNGILVEPGNVKQLADALIKVLRAKSSAVKMGQAGYELVKREHSWKLIAQKTYTVYQEVLKNYATRPKTSLYSRMSRM